MPQLHQGAKPREFPNVAAMMRHYANLSAKTWAPREVVAPAPAPTEPSRPRLAPGAFLGRLQDWAPRRVAPLDLIAQVAAFHKLTVEDLLGPSLLAPIVAARQDAMVAVATCRPELSYSAIGQVFKRDHTSVLSALKRRGAWVCRQERQAAAQAKLS